MGTVNPLGNDINSFWKSYKAQKNAIRDISRFSVENGIIKIAGEIQHFDEGEYVPKRIQRKIDTFISYALAASQQAINDSKITINENNTYKTGIFVGNNSGGWDISERGFRELYRDGANMVNPWQATAWFPAAPQGYISIVNGAKGFSKSYVADTCSGAIALKFAIQSILNGKNEVVICGGTEAPDSKLATICYAQTGQFHNKRDFQKGAQPFASKNHGMVLGEGSTFLILETLSHALKRHAPHIYAEICIPKVVTEMPWSKEVYKNMISQILKENKLHPNDIDVVLPEGNSSKNSDFIETEVLSEVFDNNSCDITIPKAQFGHLYGASTATDVMCAALFMKNNIVLPTFGEYTTLPGLKLTNKVKSNQSVNRALILGRSREGVSTGLLLKKYIKGGEKNE